MSVTMSKADGVTVLTLTSDPQSFCPPICQILKGLCISPMCGTVSQKLERIQGNYQSMLGALQIMIGLVNIGLGAILYNVNIFHWYPMCPFWSGGLFILCGAMCIVSEKHPSPCVVILNAILNLAGAAFAITAFTFYMVDVTNILGLGTCNSNNYYGYTSHNWPSSPEEELTMDKCLEGQALTLNLLRSMYAVQIVLSLLELAVTIISAVLGIGGLHIKEEEQNKSPDEQGCYKPLLEEVTSNPAV
uniref:transmembrane protein 176B-like n=1 Tax=Semicossyphus pulcher TaxID=241346 RepID=UPI0037E938C5